MVQQECLTADSLTAAEDPIAELPEPFDLAPFFDPIIMLYS